MVPTTMKVVVLSLIILDFLDSIESKSVVKFPYWKKKHCDFLLVYKSCSDFGNLIYTL